MNARCQEPASDALVSFTKAVKREIGIERAYFQAHSFRFTRIALRADIYFKGSRLKPAVTCESG